MLYFNFSSYVNNTPAVQRYNQFFFTLKIDSSQYLQVSFFLRMIQQRIMLLGSTLGYRTLLVY